MFRSTVAGLQRSCDATQSRRESLEAPSKRVPTNPVSDDGDNDDDDQDNDGDKEGSNGVKSNGEIIPLGDNEPAPRPASSVVSQTTETIQSGMWYVRVPFIKTPGILLRIPERFYFVLFVIFSATNAWILGIAKAIIASWFILGFIDAPGTMAHYDIFRQHLAMKFPAYGHALWEPDPGNLYPPVESTVGDVVYICLGKSRRLFNALLPADHSSHRNFGVPEYHEHQHRKPYRN